MKRPLAVTGFVYLAASAAAVFLGQSALIPVGAALLFCAAFSLKCTRLRMGGIVPLVLITSLAAFVSVGVYTASSVTPVQGLSGQQVIIEAELCDLPYQRYDQYYYTVNARELKARDGKVSAIQKYRHEQLRKHGHAVKVLWSREDVDDLIGDLEQAFAAVAD